MDEGKADEECGEEGEGGGDRKDGKCGGGNGAEEEEHVEKGGEGRIAGRVAADGGGDRPDGLCGGGARLSQAAVQDGGPGRRVPSRLVGRLEGTRGAARGGLALKEAALAVCLWGGGPLGGSLECLLLQERPAGSAVADRGNWRHRASAARFACVQPLPTEAARR